MNMQPIPPMQPGNASGPPQYAPPARPMDGFRIADIILTVVLALAMVPAGFFALMMALLSPMATGVCHPDCGWGVDVAWAAMWIAMPVAFLLAVGGVVLAAVKRWVMFVWPLLGCAIIGGTSVLGVEFIENAAGR